MSTRLLTIAALFAAATSMPGCQSDRSQKPPRGDGSGGPAAPPSEEDLKAPLAVIGDVVITVGDFQEHIDKQSPYIRARFQSVERKREFLDDLVRFEVLAQEAEKRGFASDPEVVRTMKQVMVQKLMKDELEKMADPDKISDEELRAFYDQHRHEYHRPEQVRASAIIVRTKSLADQVARLARGDAGKSHKGFRDLVAEHSQDEETKSRGGDLRYFGRDSSGVPAPVVEAALALAKSGDVAGPIRVDDRTYYIIQLTGRQEAIHLEFEVAQRQIKSRLLREKRSQVQRELIDSLKAKANINVYEDELKRVRIDTSAAAPPEPFPGAGAPHPHPPFGHGPGIGPASPQLP